MSPEGVINKLGTNLGSRFVGYVSQGGGFNCSGDGIIQQGNHYTSEYQDATWDGSQNDKDMACIFLCATTITFLGLSCLDWKCSVNHGWSGEKLTGDSYSGLGKFMIDMGYDPMYLNGSKRGQDVTQLLEENGKGFDGLVQPATQIIYDDFVRQIETQYQPPSKSALSHPLTACYKFARVYFTTQFKKAQSGVIDQTLTSIKDALNTFKLSCKTSAQDLQSKVGSFISTYMPEPSFLNSGCSSNLKEGLDKARDLVGKDVTLGFFGNTNGPISHLSDGLAAFIGYGSKGTFSETSTAGQITGAGIAPSNMTTHRLCDATIAFTVGVLEGCKKSTIPPKYGKPLTSVHKNKIDEVIKKLRSCYGEGPQKLQDVGASISQLTTSNFSGTGIGQFVDDVRKAFNDNLKTGISGFTETVADKIGDYLKTVFGNGTTWGSASAKEAGGKLTALASKFSNKPYDPFKDTGHDYHDEIIQLNDAITTEVKPNISYLQPVLEAGKKAFIDTLKRANYVLANYEEASQIKWNSETEKVKTCAKIFLSCIPLMMSGLSYLYWECKNGWKAMQFNSGALRGYMMYMGYHSSHLGSSTGGNVIGGIESTFKDLSGAAVAADSTYLKFYNALRTQVYDKLKSSSEELKNYPIAALYFAAQNYFTLRQSNSFGQSTGSPKSVREMLYFLAALPFSPVYEQFDKYITEYFKAVTGIQSSNDVDLKLQVADSAISSKRNRLPSGDTLSAADLKGYLTLVSHIVPRILGLIQGPGYKRGNSNEPWLFELYSNSIFQFKYSSGAALFSAISNYSYALQFQLHFLFFMCSNDGNKCGWQECLYGRDLNADTSDVTSYICARLNCSEPVDKCNHDNNTCKHNKDGQNEGCGKGSTPSSLQAFMTDNLKGFRLHDSERSSHMSQHLPGSMCHVPMGFKSADLRKNPAAGGNLYSALSAFCGSPLSPLRQLCEKLGCLTKRTPRTLGDMFGFIWHLSGQMFSFGTVVPKCQWITELPEHIPFSSAIDKRAHILKTLVGTGHTEHKTAPSAADFSSLHVVVEPQHSKCYGTAKSCGPYLSPLTLSNGATYNPAHASTYLSWILYLSDDLQSWFQDMLDEFKNIDCRTSGCVKCKDGTSHTPGTDGTTSGQCQCDSVFHCGGVLPLLYRNGFSYKSMGKLFGEGNAKTKRTCATFHSQLQSVVNGALLPSYWNPSTTSSSYSATTSSVT
ncbi:variant erythrocyte surface antigen-1 family protein [Babesia caballi]|uniref:Variant erythrocyte surface antigen-1 family protein n=1 Tax=Babesia caballi TaxID=5871 RepID=A0AAV4LNI9_BABCB|nr:variant erythrocyte surface antigen-1 family protein [Babesia caballi]